MSVAQPCKRRGPRRIAAASAHRCRIRRRDAAAAALAVAPSAGHGVRRRRGGDVILDVRNISLRFGGVKALSDISFDVREHEVRAIIGPNGAGKSSMLNCINGVYQPQEGVHHLPRPGLQAHEQPPGGADGRGAHLPEPGALQGHERGRQHHVRPQPEDEEQHLPAGAAHRTGCARGEPSTANSSSTSSTSWRSRRSARRRSVSCPTACRSAWTSAARSRWSRRCCCSTSRWPA